MYFNAIFLLAIVVFAQYESATCFPQNNIIRSLQKCYNGCGYSFLNNANGMMCLCDKYIDALNTIDILEDQNNQNINVIESLKNEITDFEKRIQNFQYERHLNEIRYTKLQNELESTVNSYISRNDELCKALALGENRPSSCYSSFWGHVKESEKEEKPININSLPYNINPRPFKTNRISSIPFNPIQFHSFFNPTTTPPQTTTEDDTVVIEALSPTTTPPQTTTEDDTVVIQALKV